MLKKRRGALLRRPENAIGRVIDDLGIVWTLLIRTRLRGKFETHSGTLRLIILGHLTPNDFWTSQMVGGVQWPTGTGVIYQLCVLFERYDYDTTVYRVTLPATLLRGSLVTGTVCQRPSFVYICLFPAKISSPAVRFVTVPRCCVLCHAF